MEQHCLRAKDVPRVPLTFFFFFDAEANCAFNCALHFQGKVKNVFRGEKSKCVQHNCYYEPNKVCQ